MEFSAEAAADRPVHRRVPGRRRLRRLHAGDDPHALNIVVVLVAFIIARAAARSAVRRARLLAGTSSPRSCVGQVVFLVLFVGLTIGRLVHGAARLAAHPAADRQAARTRSAARSWAALRRADHRDDPMVVMDAFFKTAPDAAVDAAGLLTRLLPAHGLIGPGRLLPHRPDPDHRQLAQPAACRPRSPGSSVAAVIGALAGTAAGRRGAHRRPRLVRSPGAGARPDLLGDGARSTTRRRDGSPAASSRSRPTWARRTWRPTRRGAGLPATR